MTLGRRKCTMDKHIYMTHPAMWSILNALSGIAYNSFEETLYFSPRRIDSQEELNIPLFFPDFWLYFKYSFATNQLAIEIIKVFKEGLRVSILTLINPNGEENVFPLQKAVEIKKGIKIEQDVSLNFQ